MFSSLLESAKVRLFQATDAYSRFERTKAVYKTFRQSKEEKLYNNNNNNNNNFYFILIFLGQNELSQYHG
jgi:hypothetical protein